MIKTSFFLYLTLFTLHAFGQESYKANEQYLQHSRRAYHFYEEKNYQQSALSYDSLFQKNRGQGLKGDKYNAACSWALAGNIEKAFDYLQKAVIVDKWTNLTHITSDADLQALHSDQRWETLIGKVKQNKEKVEAKFIKPLVALLDTVYKEDQYDRRNIDTIQKQFGWQSKQMDSLWGKIRIKDTVNLIRIKNIIDKYGWLGPVEVGQQGASTIFLVIQHSDSITQINYVPKMRDAVKKGKARQEDLALLEDRILTRQGKPQIYGSQVRWNEKAGKNEFFPIMDEANVNRRRAIIGLQPLEEYAKFFKFDYVLPNAAKTKSK